MQTQIDTLESDMRELKKEIRLYFGISFALTILLTILRYLMPPTVPTPPSTNSNSVQIGAESKKNPQREYLNSEEVGEREGVTSRTVIDWIEKGRIHPQPTRQGRAWNISADYRILPLKAELTEAR